MNENILVEILVFSGLMALLGSITKIILAAINKRRGGPANSEPLIADMAQRLARMEQAIDATAIEVERISEGQRFTTKVLAERAGAPAESHRARTTTPH